MSPEGITQQTNNVPLEATSGICTGTFPFTPPGALPEYLAIVANGIATCKRAQRLVNRICCLAVDLSRATETKWGPELEMAISGRGPLPSLLARVAATHPRAMVTPSSTDKTESIQD